MAFLTDKNLPSALKNEGGGTARIFEINPNTYTYSTGSDYDFGYIKDSGMMGDTPLEEVQDETLKTIGARYGNDTFGFTATLMQADSGSMEMLMDSKGKYFRGYKYNGIIDNKHWEIFYVIGQLVPKYDIKFPNPEVPVEFKGYYNKTAVTLNEAELTTYGAFNTGSFTIPANAGIYNRYTAAV